MKKKDYILYKGYNEIFWKNRKYCSKECELEKYKEARKYKRKSDSELILDEHKKGMINLNKIIKGEIVGIRGRSGSSKPNFYIPDIIKKDIEIEYELFGVTKGNYFLKKFKKNRFDNKKSKKRILVVGISDNLMKHFDKVYLFDRFHNKLKIIKTS